MKKNKFQFILNILIILVILGIVLYFSLRENYEEILDAIIHMNVWWILFAIFLLCLYRICSSRAHYMVIRENREKVSYWRCLQINFIILFFHGVTPFAGGGQPMEVYYLHQEGIPVTRAANITLQNFIVYQISLVLVGIFALVCNGIIDLFPNNHLIKQLVVFGFAINLLVLVVTFLLSFGKKFNRFVCRTGIRLLAKLKIVKDEAGCRKKFREYLDSFHDNALQLRKNLKVVMKTVFINIIGLLFFYSMPYAVARGLGIEISLLYAIVATAYVMIIGSFVPIPGGTGGVEYGFMFFFGYFIKGNVLNAIMLVWRFISYYLGMIIGAIALSLYRKGEKS